MSDQLAAKGWVTRELVDGLSARRSSDLDTFLLDPDLADHLRALTTSTHEAIQLWTGGVKVRAAELNEAHVEQALRDDTDFFNTIERSPLTEEQARAFVSTTVSRSSHRRVPARHQSWSPRPPMPFEATWSNLNAF